MEITKLADNLGLDADDFVELFELYMQTTACDLKELRAGLKAGDAEQVHKKAHSIKGSSGNLGLDELYRLARDIDDRARVGSLDGLEDLLQVFDNKYENFVEDFEKDRSVC